jgi:polyphosphate:AMP phosphotransferase
MPTRGRIAVFDRSWYRLVSVERVEGRLPDGLLNQAFLETQDFERKLADDETVIIKFFLHIDKKEQKRRLSKLEATPAIAWRVTKADWRQRRDYDRWLRVAEEMFENTDTGFAPWTIVEATDERWATVKVLTTFINAVEAAIERKRAGIESAKRSEEPAPKVEFPVQPHPSALDKVDLSVALAPAAHERQFDKYQRKIRELEHELYTYRVPLVVVFEGQDAAGKGGAIRRLTANLDPRCYRDVPSAAPNDIEKAHHCLWCFWINMPKSGHITILDRSWYGRVLVERVEGFCSDGEWRRAYREINAMENHLVSDGTCVVKFWLQIDPNEQLRRFEDRQKDSSKAWKITEEDWRNRVRWDEHKVAIDEALFRTSTTFAPWTIVESNNKEYARIKVLKTIVEAVERRLGRA